MNITGNSVAARRQVWKQQGFAVYTLGSRKVEVSVVPELGAKIVSLKHLQTGREWLWHPGDEVALFRNRPGDDFSKGTLVGADECLPTIAPCLWQGRALPDHGEVWTAAWSVERDAWADGVLRTSTRLVLSPFQLERTMQLKEDQIRLSYQLRNLSAAAESYLWAFHPLLRLQSGDRLQVPASTRALLNGRASIDSLDSDMPKGECAKVFAAPLSQGAAAICNERSGDRRDFEWNPAENNTLGLWLTRGGWHGHHHLALEPTNGEPDALALAAAQNRCGVIGPFSSVTWQLSLRISP